MENGQIRIQNLENVYDISQLGPSWCLSVHDNFYGYVTGLLQSYDSSTLISTGADGNFFQFAIMGQEQLDKKIAENKAKLPSAKVRVFFVHRFFELWFKFWKMGRLILVKSFLDVGLETCQSAWYLLLRL